MIEKNLLLKSDFLGGKVAIAFEENYVSVKISITIYEQIESECVIKAFFADKSTKEIKNIGIIDNFGNLNVKVPNEICTDTIVFGLKNTITDKLRYVGYAYLNEEWTLEDEKPIANAKKVLEKIKSDEIKEENYSKITDGIFYEITQNLKHHKKLNLQPLDGYTLYKIENFYPISNISSIKYAMFERDVNYSFDEFKHYIFGVNKNKILLAFASKNKINPMSHIDNLCFSFYIDKQLYYGVIIELADDGQYFIKD